MMAETRVASGFPTYKSATRVDIALLASALFLQRFTFHLFGTVLAIDFVAAALIFMHQFASGRLFIQYDRLLWFLAVVLAATSSLLLNSNSRLTSYGLFVVIYFLFTLTRASTPERYKSTLQGFQFLVLILSWLAIAQFLAQFIVNPGRLVMFFGIFPDSLLTYPGESVAIGAKSNGIFLAEASTMSQIAALGILIEVLEFRRPRYLMALTLAFLLAYGGTGMTILLLSLPLAVLVNRRAQLPAMLVSLVALGLFATGIIHLSNFTSRLSEFKDPHASGFLRFVSSFWMAADYFHTASLPEFLFGNGPGYGAIRGAFYATSSNSWFKLFLEYGAIGAFVFTCFLGFCLRKSRCPKPLIVALIYNFLFTSSNLLGTSASIIMVVLCTLSGPEPRRARINEPGQYPSSLVTGSTAG
jgi:hypothetical protein